MLPKTAILEIYNIRYPYIVILQNKIHQAENTLQINRRIFTSYKTVGAVSEVNDSDWDFVKTQVDSF